MSKINNLTPAQINLVVEWMNEWEQLKDTAIPMRFKEDFSKHLKCIRARYIGLSTNRISKKELVIDEFNTVIFTVREELPEGWLAISKYAYQLRLAGGEVRYFPTIWAVIKVDSGGVITAGWEYPIGTGQKDPKKIFEALKSMVNYEEKQR